MTLFRKHLPESLALASIVAAALALQVSWVVNLLISRSLVIREWLTFIPSFGALSGVVIVTAVVYLASLLVVLLWYRQRDCSHQREHILWVFLVSLLIFFIMTLPGIYSLSITEMGL